MWRHGLKGRSGQAGCGRCVRRKQHTLVMGGWSLWFLCMTACSFWVQEASDGALEVQPLTAAQVQVLATFLEQLERSGGGPASEDAAAPLQGGGQPQTPQTEPVQAADSQARPEAPVQKGGASPPSVVVTPSPSEQGPSALPREVPGQGMVVMSPRGASQQRPVDAEPVGTLSSPEIRARAVEPSRRAEAEPSKMLASAPPSGVGAASSLSTDGPSAPVSPSRATPEGGQPSTASKGNPVPAESSRIREPATAGSKDTAVGRGGSAGAAAVASVPSETPRRTSTQGVTCSVQQGALLSEGEQLRLSSLTPDAAGYLEARRCLARHHLLKKESSRAVLILGEALQKHPQARYDALLLSDLAEAEYLSQQLTQALAHAEQAERYLSRISSGQPWRHEARVLELQARILRKQYEVSSDIALLERAMLRWRELQRLSAPHDATLAARAEQELARLEILKKRSP